MPYFLHLGRAQYKHLDVPVLNLDVTFKLDIFQGTGHSADAIFSTLRTCPVLTFERARTYLGRDLQI